MDFSKIVNKFDVMDIALIKLGVLFFAFWIVSASATIANWVIAMNHWIFFAAFVILIARPLYRAYFKKEKKLIVKKVVKKKRK